MTQHWNPPVEMGYQLRNHCRIFRSLVEVKWTILGNIPTDNSMMHCKTVTAHA